MVRTLGKASRGTAARDALGWLKECMDHYRFHELSKKSPNELCQHREVLLLGAVAMELERIRQEPVPMWFWLQ